MQQVNDDGCRSIHIYATAVPIPRRNICAFDLSRRERSRYKSDANMCSAARIQHSPPHSSLSLVSLSMIACFLPGCGSLCPPHEPALDVRSHAAARRNRNVEKILSSKNSRMNFSVLYASVCLVLFAASPIHFHVCCRCLVPFVKFRWNCLRAQY